MTVLTDLPAGHDFPPIAFSVNAAQSRAYRAATGDTLPLYDEAGLVPPLAVAALALGALLESVSLPPGTLHASESVTYVSPVPVDATLECRARLAQRSVRGGWVVSVLDSDILLDGTTAVSTRATVMSPAAPS
ncbi:MAG TPA: MaoC family dehydratase N-terminal domain-containing protein [Dehalococcoidia bacterium]|nr:MaoC family dehydratase N-terminal domain-containing protein [Dehalococcoidia bacterium]